MTKLSGSQCFSKIDLAAAYNQIKLAPKRQRKLDLSPTRGVLLQTRLPFGITSATEYFQKIMDRITSDLSGVAVYLDDILVGGSSAEEHIKNLRALLQRLQDKFEMQSKEMLFCSSLCGIFGSLNLTTWN